MRIVSLLMVLAMLFSFAACAKDPVNPADTTDGTGDTTPAETTAEPDPLDVLPEMNFENADFIIWGDIAFSTNFFVVNTEETEGDVVAEAVADRTNAVEERFAITLKYDVTLDNVWRGSSGIQQSILAGDRYDILEGPVTHLTPLTVQGCFTDLSTAEYQNFAEPWWASNVIRELEIGGRLFNASGFFDFPTVARSNVYYFNATLVENYHLPDLYDLVNKGEWTFDRMTELAETVADDVNQDGRYDEHDMYGISGSWDSWGSQVLTAGYSWTTMNEDGTRTLTGMNDTLARASELIYPLITERNYYYSMYSYGGPHNEDNAIGLFCNDQILFLMTGIGLAADARLRDMGTYGILPSPKLTADQKDYGTTTGAFVCGMPITANDYDTASLILEALQIASYEYLRPAYYETALSKKYLNDPQSVEMLDIVFRNVYCDFASCYGTAGIGSAVDTSAVAHKQDIASYVASVRDAANNAIQYLEEQMEQMLG